MSEYLKNYRKENPEKIAAIENKRRSDPVKRARDARARKNSAYRQKYGITLDEAFSLLEKQDGGCAICQRVLDDRTMRVDHCHTHGHVRGILCNKCNYAIGQLGDTAESVERALAYLLAQSTPGATQ